MVLVLCFAISTLPLASAAQDSWTTLEPMQQARAGLGVVAVNGKIYALGGTTASGFMPSIPAHAILGNRDIGGHVGTNEEYDPATNISSYKESMPTPRILFATAVYKNKIYCMGGKTFSGSYTSVNEVYDPATDTWETKASMPQAEGWITANVIDARIHIIGGQGKHFVYDPAMNSWTTEEPLPYSSDGEFISAALDEKIYVIGGASEDAHYNLIQIYDTKTAEWRLGAYPPSSVGGGATAATTGGSATKSVYVLGVVRNLRQGEPDNFVRIYEPQSDSWKFGANPDLSHFFNFGVAVLNDKLFAIGGLTYNGLEFEPTDINQQYTPIDYIPEFPSWIILPLILGVSFVVVMVRNRLRRQEC